MSKKFEQIVTVQPSFDKRSSEAGKNFGIGGCLIRFVLKGENGAVQFLIGTDWFVPSAREHLNQFAARRGEDLRKPTGWDVGYHSPKPMYEGQSSMKCDLMPTGECYYDGSGCRADQWVEDFISGGTEWLWKKLEEEYMETFK